MFTRRLLATVGLLAVFGLWLTTGASAQVRVEAPRVEIDIPDRRPNPLTGVDMGDLVGGVFALRDGFDRSRRGFICALTYDDRNGNGRRDRGEGPLPGWSFTITDAAGATVAQGQSNKDGRFCNAQPLAPGAYSVRQAIGGDWTNSEPGAGSPNLKPVTLPADSSVTVLFGNCRGERCARESGGELRGGPGGPTPQGLGKICVLKFHDVDNDGWRSNNSEPFLPNWTFTVSGPSGTFTGQTDLNGQWCTPHSLGPGSYFINETMKPGWSATIAGPTRTINLSAGLTTTVMFGNKPAQGALSSVCVQKFNDLNGDGLKQGNEPWLSGWQFTVSSISQVQAQGVTDANGKYCTAAILTNGAYTLAETLQPGWTSTTMAGGATPTKPLSITTGGQTINVMAGNRKAPPPASSTVCVMKFNDLNGDGVRQTGEPGLPGWVFNLAWPNGSNTLILPTGTNGGSCFTSQMPAGSYTLTETAQAGWSATTPGGVSQTFALAPGNSITRTFGNRQTPPTTARVCAVKFNDLDGDGVRDTGEGLLAGWTFTVQGGSPPSGVTGSDGLICWTLPAGTYSLVETLKPGWASTSPGGPNPTRTTTLAAGDERILPFGNRQTEPGKVCIVKYNDLNQNAAHDTGEPQLPGWTFTLYAGATSGGAQVGQVTTGPSGTICRQLPPGTYSAYETMQAGWANSDPPGPPLHKTFTIVPGDVVTIVFGNYQPPKLRFTKLVTSTAPGGGFPTTGLVGGKFQVVHHCVLGNQSGGNGTSLSAGQTAPMAGYTGASVGALCTVTETLPPGPIAFADCPSGTGHWEPPVITTTPFTVVGGWNDTTVANRFVCDAPPPPVVGDLCVTKYQDLDGDGIRDTGEPPLAGWTFTLSNGATGVTGANGRICWTVPVGGYTVTETPQTGWINTDPGGATPSKPATVTAGDTAKLFFGNRQLPQPGKLCVVKYHDQNVNGVRDTGEPPVAGMTFKAQSGTGPIHTGASAADGRICWEVPPGAYTVKEIVGAGWQNSDPGSLFPSKPATVVSGQTTEVAFGNHKSPLMRFRKVVTSTAPGGGFPTTGLGANGAFQINYNCVLGNQNGFGGLPLTAGQTAPMAGFTGVSANAVCTVTETLPPGLIAYAGCPSGQGHWAAPAVQSPFTVGEGMNEVVVTNQFVCEPPPPPQPGEICVEKYNDLDGDGVRDTGEPGLPGWSFTVRDASGAVVGQGVTGANGRWCMPALAPPGAYTVSETMQPGWTSTDPGGSAPSKAVTVGPNQTVTAAFGNRANATPPNLTMVKTKLTAGICHGSQAGANNCIFRFTITNTGGTAYTGPLSISDVVTLGGPLSVSVVTPPPGWICSSGSVTTMICSIGSVTIAANATVTYDLELFLNAPMPSQKNCAVLTWGGGQQTAQACVQIFP